MFGIWQIIGKKENSENVSPPVHFMQKTGLTKGKICKPGCKNRTYRINTNDLMSRNTRMNKIKCIHSQQGDHQKKNQRQGNIGIHMKLVFHFNPGESFYMHNCSANKESNDQHSNDQGKNIAGSKNNVIYHTKKTQNSLGSCQSVNHHFDTPNQDHQESPPYQGMHQSYHRPA